MAAPPARLGDLLPDERLVYRGFAEKSFRHRKKNEVRYQAYFLRERDAADGLSVGLTPEAAVRYLEHNEGYCSIPVSAIHGLQAQLGLPFPLQVRQDLDDPAHAFICGLPLRTLSDQSLDMAIFVGSRLAERSKVVTCDPYPPPKTDGPPE